MHFDKSKWSFNDDPLVVNRIKTHGFFGIVQLAILGLFNCSLECKWLTPVEEMRLVYMFSVKEIWWAAFY